MLEAIWKLAYFLNICLPNPKEELKFCYLSQGLLIIYAILSDFNNDFNFVSLAISLEFTSLSLM